MKHGADIGAIAAFLAAGGLGGVTLGFSTFYPAHATQINAAGLIVISIAGLIRTVTNPTPTNSIQLTDRNTGATVNVRTVDAPSPAKDPPSQPPAPLAEEPV